MRRKVYDASQLVHMGIAQHNLHNSDLLKLGDGYPEIRVCPVKLMRLKSISKFYETICDRDLFTTTRQNVYALKPQDYGHLLITVGLWTTSLGGKCYRSFI